MIICMGDVRILKELSEAIRSLTILHVIKKQIFCNLFRIGLYYRCNI